MKKTKLYKSTAQMIIYTIIFIICLVLCIIIGTKDYSKDKLSDNLRFSSIYDKVSEDNVYKFATATDVLSIINNGSGIILMGFPLNKWTNDYAYIINDVAKEKNIKEIYYYDFLDDRENKNGTYETIVNELSVYTITDDLGKKNIYAPTLMVVKEGKVIGYFDDTAIMKGSTKPELYYTDGEVSRIKREIGLVFDEYLK